MKAAQLIAGGMACCWLFPDGRATSFDSCLSLLISWISDGTDGSATEEQSNMTNLRPSSLLTWAANRLVFAQP